MAEESAVLESATAEVVMDVSRGPLVNMTSDERAEFRTTGEMPKPKIEEAAPSKQETAQKAETAGESEPPKVQEPPKSKPKQTAEERIAQLEATIEKIRKGAETKQAPKAESQPADVPKPEPTQYTRPKPTVDDKTDDGKPKFATYEDYIEDLADWKAEQREVKTRREAQEAAQAREFNSKVEEAKARYQNFEEVVEPTAKAINDDAGIPSVIKQMLRDSEVLADFLYTVGSDSAELAKFTKMAKETPRKAIEYVVLTESLIRQELEAKTTSEEIAPVKPKTQAPKPPSEAGGRAATPPDALESAAKSNDFRAFKAEQLRRDLAKLKS